MNVSQIRQKAEMYCGTTIEDDMLLSVVNEALEYIGDLADIYDEVEVDAIDIDEWYQLPETTTNIVNVYDSSGNPFSEWQTRGYKIKFDTADTYTVTVKRIPESVTSISDEPDCHILFHRAIVTYLRGYVKLTKDDTSADGARLTQQFFTEIQGVADIIDRNRKR